MKARRPIAVTRTLLNRLPLPRLQPEDDKEARGRVLAIGGSRLVPGAILLAGIGALRAGAGKLQMATINEAAIPLGVAVPEALVVGLRATGGGEIDASAAAKTLAPYAANADAVLVGPGMCEAKSAGPLIGTLARHMKSDAVLIVDGAAIAALGEPRLLQALGGRAIVTPHAGEMAGLLGIPKARVTANAPELALQAASELQATVILKGAQSWIAAPEGALYRFDGGTVGLGTSGSGDTLAGIVTGLCARGATVETAATWSVWIHANAGRRLAQRHATIGYLARELLAEVPALTAHPAPAARKRSA